MNQLKHRPEVDGLRALAVAPVVLFHAGLGCPGGYVGVDVFFVISGYLITALILQAMAAGEFTLIRFWERRVRRIAPALVVMVAATLAAGALLLLPEDLYLLGKAAIAQSLLVSNIHFWGRSGYFDGGVEGDPLLHTWSLAVEEQFYLFLPLVLLALRRFSARSMKLVLCGGLLASLIASIYGVHAHPSATFYLLPTRAWELLLGSMIALAPDVLRATPRWMREAIGVAGIAAILAAVYAYDRTTTFPGAAALLPCCGTAAVIWANAGQLTFSGRLLSLRPFVGIGMISYSLYLWHWPVLVFARYWANPELSTLHRWLLIAISVVLAILSWKFVETPFRRGQWLPQRRALFSTALVAIASLLLVGVGFKLSHGLPFRVSEQVNTYALGKKDRVFLKRVTLADARQGRFIEIGVQNPLGAIDLLIWGDSHAMAVLPILEELCTEYSLHGVAATYSATAPLVGFESPSPYGLRRDSLEYNQIVLDFARQRRVKNVLLVAKWANYEAAYRADSASGKSFGEHLRSTAQALQDSGARVWIMAEVPHQQQDVPRALAKACLIGQDASRVGVSLQTHRARIADAEAAIRDVAKLGVVVLDPVDLLADATGLCRTESAGKALYRDEHHLSVTGSKELRPLFEPMLRPALAQKNVRD